MPEHEDGASPSEVTSANSATPAGVSGGTTQLDLMRMVLADGKLDSEEKRMLIDELRKNNPGTSDRWTYRYAILTLGGAVVLTIIALTILSTLADVKIPEGLVSIGSAAVGGLAGLLTPGRSSENG